MKKVNLIVFLLLIATTMVIGQNEKKSPALKLSGISLNVNSSLMIDRPRGGGGFYYYLNPVFSQFNVTPYIDGTDYNNSYFSPESQDYGIMADVNFKIFDKKTNNYFTGRNLQFGLGYAYCDRYFAFFSNYNNQPLDTLDKTLGHLVFHDSSSWINNDFYIQYNMVAINASYRYCTKSLDGLSLFVAPGIGLNFSLFSNCDYVKSESTDELFLSQSVINSNGDTTLKVYTRWDNTQYNFYDISNSLFFRPFVSYGLLYQLPIIHKVNLFCEFKSGFEFQFCEFSVINRTIFNGFSTGIMYKF